MRLTTVAFLCGFVGGSGCAPGVAHIGVPGELGDACDTDSECESEFCIPYGTGQICSQPCISEADCANDLLCLENGSAGMWCLPAGSCSCEGRCCGDDGCGNPCPDTCEGTCNTTTCECSQPCTPDETRACTAYGTCAGTQTCVGNDTWSECTNDQWSCTEPGVEQESCMAGACEGVRTCEQDCGYGDCAPDCATGTDCCGDGCVDLDTDRDNCGACDRACLLYLNSDVATDPCYNGACAMKCCRNGSETCDDEFFFVPDPYVPMYLVCTQAGGGVGYVATGTGPPCDSDGTERCRCWAENADPVDFHTVLPDLYIPGMVMENCDAVGKFLLLDLSAYAGEKLYVGAHEQLDGSGHMTRVCIATGP